MKNGAGSYLECRYFPHPETSGSDWLIKLHANNAIGGGDWRALRAFREFAHALGCGAVVFNYRGVGGSEGVIRCANDLIADTEAVIQALVAATEAPPSRIHLYGHSIGGRVAIAVRARGRCCQGTVLADRTFGSLGGVMAAHSAGLCGILWGAAVGALGVGLRGLLFGAGGGAGELSASVGLVAWLGSMGALRWPWGTILSVAQWEFGPINWSRTGEEQARRRWLVAVSHDLDEVIPVAAQLQHQREAAGVLAFHHTLDPLPDEVSPHNHCWMASGTPSTGRAIQAVMREAMDKARGHHR